MSSDGDIVVLATGGTIDKFYSLDGELEIGPPAAQGIFAQVAVADAVQVVPVLAKDSLDLTDEDRALLVEQLDATEARRVVITHGTDTMAQTASYLVEHARGGATVVLTGALQPAAMSVTDAHFNLGFAVAAAQLCPPRVYVAMSGQVFPAGEVVKEQASGVFTTPRRTAVRADDA